MEIVIRKYVFSFTNCREKLILVMAYSRAVAWGILQVKIRVKTELAFPGSRKLKYLGLTIVVLQTGKVNDKCPTCLNWQHCLRDLGSGFIEELCHWGWGLEVSKPCVISSVLSLLPAYGLRYKTRIQIKLDHPYIDFSELYWVDTEVHKSLHLPCHHGL